MDPLECYTVGDALKEQNVRFPDNLQKKNLNSESKRGPIQTAQIFEPTQGCKASLRALISRVTYEAILEHERKE